ncbi:MAG: hypothetical protein ABI823_20775 [Bryobacteraceae bacterium]
MFRNAPSFSRLTNSADSGILPWMVGILVHGDNHFIVRGPLPDRGTALALVRQWSVIEIGKAPEPELGAWRISTKEFREHLEWAIAVPAETGYSAAVAQLLGELAARGIRLLRTDEHGW